MSAYLNVLAAALMFIGGIPYAISMIKGPSQAVKATWLVYATLDGITFAAMWVANTWNGQVLGAFIMSAGTFLVTLRYGKPGWTKLDVACLSIGFIGLVLWYFFSDPNLAIATSLFVVIVGTIPTFKSAWDEPKNESGLGWILFFSSSIPAMMAIPKWDFGNAAQPIVFALVQGTMLILIYRRVLKK